MASRRVRPVVGGRVLMPSLSDLNHMDTCNAKHCRTMDLRANMFRIKGRRGYFCQHCTVLYDHHPRLL
jgi:hypothetical protein